MKIPWLVTKVSLRRRRRRRRTYGTIRLSRCAAGKKCAIHWWYTWLFLKSQSSDFFSWLQAKCTKENICRRQNVLFFSSPSPVTYCVVMIGNKASLLSSRWDDLVFIITKKYYNSQGYMCTTPGLLHYSALVYKYYW